MLDVEELEQQWKKYNRKKKRPLYIGGFLVSTILGGWFIINSHYFDISKLKDIIPKFDLSSKKDVKNTNYTTIEKHSEQKSFIHKKYLLNNSLDSLYLTTTKNKDISHKNTFDTPLDESDLYIEKDISKPSIRKRPVSIIKVSNNNAYKDVEIRFKRMHNINDAIFLANMYYNKKNYKKAIYWSMQTNKLDKNIEESWLIFAKSKVRLGKKNEAIRVLKAYIKRSNSYEAKKLLKKIMNR